MPTTSMNLRRSRLALGIAALMLASASYGQTPSFALSYVLPPDQNVVPIADGATISFPDTLVGTSISAGFTVANSGSGSGQVTGIEVTGTGFKIQNRPFLPATLSAGQGLQVQVVHQPTAAANDTGTLAVTTSLGTYTIHLTGRGVVAQLTYQLQNPSASVAPGDTIPLPAIELTKTSTRQLRISNSGTTAATITQVNVSGTGFQLAAPAGTPLTLQPGASATLTLAFTPTQGGTSTGALAVNSDTFVLSGTGLAPLLSYSYSVAGNVVTVGSGTGVIFSPVQVTKSSIMNLTVTNSGGAAATISNVAVTANGTAFSISPAPALPTTIAPNTSLNIPIRFAPLTVGQNSATLAIDATNIPLLGSGTQPPAIPSYTISAPTGATAPFTQPTVSLKLASPYPVDLSGTLTLTPTSGALAADPAVQFATGGRTVSFRIPANTTDAVFGTTAGSLGTQIGFQTGTVAAGYTLTPTFATQTGNIDLTPPNPTTAQFSVAAAAPSLLNVAIANSSANSLTVEVIGYTTTRSLTSLNITFKTASGFSMPQSSFTINLAGASATWFQSAASQNFGGQFRVSVPFTFQLPTSEFVLNGIAGVSATISNATGASQTLAVTTR